MLAAILCSFLVITSASSPSQVANDLFQATTDTLNLSSTAVVNQETNLTSVLPEISATTEIKVSCNGAQFGRGLVYERCLDAISTFQSPVTGNATVGPRGQDQRYNFNLPWRWISDDGRCALDIVKSHEYAFAIVTVDELISAATTLVDTCVRDRGGKGGIVSGIGKPRKELRNPWRWEK